MIITLELVNERYRADLILLRDAALEAGNFLFAVLLSHLLMDLTGRDSQDVD